MSGEGRSFIDVTAASSSTLATKDEDKNCCVYACIYKQGIIEYSCDSVYIAMIIRHNTYTHALHTYYSIHIHTMTTTVLPHMSPRWPPPGSTWADWRGWTARPWTGACRAVYWYTYKYKIFISTCSCIHKTHMHKITSNTCGKKNITLQQGIYYYNYLNTVLISGRLYALILL